MPLIRPAEAGAAILVAEENGIVCTMATYQMIPVLHEYPPRGQLTGLVVSERARRRGIGVALVRYAKQLDV